MSSSMAIHLAVLGYSILFFVNVGKIHPQSHSCSLVSGSVQYITDYLMSRWVLFVPTINADLSTGI